MEDNLNILVYGRVEDNLKNKITITMQPKTNKSLFLGNFKEQHTTVTSRQPDQHNNQNYIVRIINKKNQPKLGVR